MSVPVDVIATLTKLVELVDDNYNHLDSIKDAEAKGALFHVLTTVDETFVSVLSIHDKENDWEC